MIPASVLTQFPSFLPSTVRKWLRKNKMRIFLYPLAMFVDMICNSWLLFTFSWFLLPYLPHSLLLLLYLSPLFIFKSCWWIFPNDSLFHCGKACRIIRYHLVEFYNFSPLVFQSIFLLLCINTVYISLVWQFLFIYLYCSHLLSRINICLFQLQQITHIKYPLEAPGQEGSIRGE